MSATTQVTRIDYERKVCHEIVVYSQGALRGCMCYECIEGLYVCIDSICVCVRSPGVSHHPSEPEL